MSAAAVAGALVGFTVGVTAGVLFALRPRRPRAQAPMDDDRFGSAWGRPTLL